MKNLKKTYTEKDLENIFSELQFSPIKIPVFKGFSNLQTKSPYTFSIIQKRAISIIFAIPAVLSVFAFSFYFLGNKQVSESNKLALLQESNNRILTQINNLEK